MAGPAMKVLNLVEHSGRVLDKDELLAAVWPDVTVEENNLGQAISRIRSALGEAPGDNRFIVTIPGRGYRFVPEGSNTSRTFYGSVRLFGGSTCPARYPV